MNNSEDYWLSRPDLAGRLKLPVTTLTKWAYEKKGPTLRQDRPSLPVQAK